MINGVLVIQKNVIMKRTVVISVFAITICSCGQKNDSRYIPIEGLNGHVKQVSTSYYQNDFEKNQKIAKFGELIPDSIEYYNKQGGKTSSVFVNSFKDFPEFYSVLIDSVYYDKHGNAIGTVKYEIYIHQKDVLEYKNPKGLIMNNFYIKEQMSVDVHRNKNTLTETKTTCISFDKSLFDSFSDDFKEFIREVCHVFSVEPMLSNDRLRGEVRSINKSSTISTFDGDNIVSKMTISDSDTTETQYVYKDGRLFEEKEGKQVLRYDDRGRIIYAGGTSLIHITEGVVQSPFSTVYKDSTKFTISEGLFGGPTLELTKMNSENRRTFFARLMSWEESNEEGMRLFEDFADGLITEAEFCSGLKKIGRNTDDSPSIIKYSYLDYDSHHNPLRIVRRYEDYYDFGDSESRGIEERTIEYYD